MEKSKLIMEKSILVKAVYYRFFDGEDKTTRQYFIQIAKDGYNNPYDLEISHKQFSQLLDDGAIKCLASARTEIPPLHPEMPGYCYHSLSTDIYEFNETF